MQQPLAIKLCENTKSYKSAYPGSNKVVYGACEQESEEKYPTFWFFEYAKLDLCKKKLLVQKKYFFFIMLLCISKDAYCWVDFRTKTKLKTLRNSPSYS